MSAYYPDTIVAIATAPGRGGVGIVRISGDLSLHIASQIAKLSPNVRHAHYCTFHLDNNPIDQGILLFFKAPHSFTGEDVLELQAHGGPVLLDMLVEECVKLGARLARPGEFSERAFLNDKLDLSQAEAIADLIDATSKQAAKQAFNSLQGAFSQQIEMLTSKLMALRIYVESAIDFPEEEIDFLSGENVIQQLLEIVHLVQQTRHQAQQGVLMREGLRVVIAGRPNAGKSSLLNALADQDLAIVTDIAGTTRDVLKEHIHIDGLPLHIIDTAGLRDSADQVEQIGIKRAWREIEQADCILLMIDSTDPEQLKVLTHWPEFFTDATLRKKLTLLYNKIDLSDFQIVDSAYERLPQLAISALQKSGIDELKLHLKQIIGFESTTEGSFSARRRHLQALEQAAHYLDYAKAHLDSGTGELLAEDLRCAQHCLGEIIGHVSADDLLGQIFSNFCIGK